MAKKSVGMAMPPGHDDYEAENDVRHLIEAEKIKGNPHRLKRAMKKHRELKKAVNAVKC